MENENLIPAQDFCKSHDLADSFVHDLEQFGLLEITTVQEISYLHAGQLEKAERMARLYTDLGINLEGIDAISHILQRVEQMQQEIAQLRSRLSGYED